MANTLYKKNPYKRKSKRSYKKKSTMSAISAALSKPTLPNKQVVPFHYRTYNQVSSTLGAMGSFTLRTNSIYDPDKTGVGHQPVLYDAFLGANSDTAPYSNYKVYATRISATIYPNSSNTQATKFGWYTANGSTTVTGNSWIDLEENKNRFCKTGEIVPTATQSKTISQIILIKDIYNVKDLDDEDFWGQWSGNPPNQVDSTFFIEGVDGTAVSHYVTFKMDYLCVLGNRNIVDTS